MCDVTRCAKEHQPVARARSCFSSWLCICFILSLALAFAFLAVPTFLLDMLNRARARTLICGEGLMLLMGGQRASPVAGECAGMRGDSEEAHAQRHPPFVPGRF